MICIFHYLQIKKYQINLVVIDKMCIFAEKYKKDAGTRIHSCKLETDRIHGLTKTLIIRNRQERIKETRWKRIEKYAFNDEQYGIAFRKGSTKTVAMVNSAINELIKSGKLQEIATKYKLDKQVDTTLADIPADDTLDTADWEYIKEKGTLVIGITYFEPMNYLDDNNELTGFETEFAKAVCEILGVTPVFQEISWNSKEMELNGKTIDCIWNGLTIDDERQETMQISKPYMNNKQVMVVKTENVEKY